MGGEKGSHHLEFATEIVVSLVIGGVVAYAFQRAHSVRLQTQLDERTDQLKDATRKRDLLVEENKELAEKYAEAQTQVREFLSAQAERDKALTKRREELDTHFKGLASDVLKSSTSELREQAVENVVKPVQERLNELRNDMDKYDKARIEDTSKVSDTIAQLMKETSDLREILRIPQSRGEWGEQHLRNVIEAAGLTPHVDYIEQGTIAGNPDGGTLRPDVQVKIPGGATVVIDAKTPHDQYDAALRSDNERERAQLLVNHADALADHARALSGRNYTQWVHGSPDFVIMYVPTDPMLDAAIKAKPAIWQDTWRRHRILIATPGLLIAFLRTVALAWQQQDIQENAQKIAETAGDLYSRLKTYTDHMNKMGQGLRQAVERFNKGVGSLQRRVMPKAREFEKLGVTTEAESIKEVAQIESNVRRLSAGDD